MNTPISLLLAVDAIGGRLAIAEDDGRLRMLLPADCDPQLKAAIRANKAALLELLVLPFAIVRSDVLHGAIVFWTATEEGRDLLMRHGVQRGSIWTHAELDRVVRLNTDADGLYRIHVVKTRFQGRITENP